MPGTRLFIDAALASGCEVQLDASQARYLGRVLRMRPGDELAVFNGSDGEFLASLAKIGKDYAAVLVGGPVATATESALKIHLVQGISRGERMDYVVQKATELGVKRITPVLTEYGVVRLDADRAARRRDHWEQVARSACEQCGRIRPPLVEAPVMLNRWLGTRPASADLDLILRPGAANALACVAAPRTKVCLLVGPEGGFSLDEYDAAQAAGFEPVGLGPRILRTETAAVTALAIAQASWGDLS